jgi:hypothetical protein
LVVVVGASVIGRRRAPPLATFTSARHRAGPTVLAAAGRREIGRKSACRETTETRATTATRRPVQTRAQALDTRTLICSLTTVPCDLQLVDLLAVRGEGTLGENAVEPLRKEDRVNVNGRVSLAYVWTATTAQ